MLRLFRFISPTADHLPDPRCPVPAKACELRTEVRHCPSTRLPLPSPAAAAACLATSVPPASRHPRLHAALASGATIGIAPRPCVDDPLVGIELVPPPLARRGNRPSGSEIPVQLPCRNPVVDRPPADPKAPRKLGLAYALFQIVLQTASSSPIHACGGIPSPLARPEGWNRTPSSPSRSAQFLVDKTGDLQLSATACAAVIAARHWVVTSMPVTPSRRAFCPATSPKGDWVMGGVIAAHHHASTNFLLTGLFAATGRNVAFAPPSLPECRKARTICAPENDSSSMVRSDGHAPTVCYLLR